jgi:hypothetical protein
MAEPPNSPPSPSAAPARLAPERLLPPYTYVPGRAPHPITDPAGHSHGCDEVEVSFSADQWELCEEYRFGFDLFDNGFYWESHEAWEAAWHAVGRRGWVADHLKALIKLAAAMVKHKEGRPEGVARHARRAIELFSNNQENHGDQICGTSMPLCIELAQYIRDEIAQMQSATNDAVALLRAFPVSRSRS